jgi:site-specific DNA recombinase
MVGLAKRRVRLVSITQEPGDDPAQVMMRQVIALFDEYQERQARAALREGERAPGLLDGYTAVEVARRASRIDKKLAIDPVEAETVRLMFKLFLRALEHVRGQEHVVQPGRPGHKTGPP